MAEFFATFGAIYLTILAACVASLLLFAVTVVPVIAAGVGGRDARELLWLLTQGVLGVGLLWPTLPVVMAVGLYRMCTD